MAEEVTEKLGGLSVKADTGDDELPEDLKKLIEESVAEPSKPQKKSITTDDLIKFFEIAREKLSEETLEDIRKVLDTKEEECKDANKKVELIRKELEVIYNSIWADFGIDETLGRHAVVGVEKTIENTSLDVDFRKKLDTKVAEFTQKEHEIVSRGLFGEERYKKRLEEQEEVSKVKIDLENEIMGAAPEKRGKMILDLKNKAFSLREKLMNMPQSEAVEYLDNMKGEEKTIMTRLSALAMLLQENVQIAAADQMNSHGHSHNGQPCHGHGGHGHSHESHGHSHDNNDHGHSHEAHGHSHGGKPCHGHGH